MIIVNLGINPSYNAKLIVGYRLGGIETRELVKGHFAPAIPDLIVKETGMLGLDANTSSKAVRVHNHVFDEHDVNPPNLGLVVDFPGSPQDEMRFLYARHSLYQIFTNWLIGHGIVPELITSDLIWGSRHGMGKIDDTRGLDSTW